MYLSFYRLREFPFSTTCDERFFYESPRHGEALARLMYIVENRRGMVLVTGDVGAGKTFLSNVLVSRLSPMAIALRLKHPFDTAKQLVRTVNRSVGAGSPFGTDKLALVEGLEDYLVKLAGRRLVVLIFDEVQDLDDGALEEIRLLWNMEARGQRLLQIVLMGQPELRQRLAGPRWAALVQRVAMSYHLGPLGLNETTAYVLHRRRIAKDEECLLKFTPNAMKEIYRASKGIPRLINILCDNALLVGYSKGQHVISSAIVREVVTDRSQHLPSPSLTAVEKAGRLPPLTRPLRPAAGGP